MFGRLATSILSTTSTWTKIYTASSNCKGVKIDINVLNPSASDATIEIAYSTNATSPTSNENVEQGIVVKANGGTLIRTDDKLSPGEFVYAKTSVAGVKIRVSGKTVSLTA